MPPPKFLYFDLGNVLAHFSLERLFRQIGAVSGVEPGKVEEILFGNRLQYECEIGRCGCREFYDIFCRETGTRPDYDALVEASCDIFELNVSIVPVVSQLRAAGYRLGILSNTCESHWEYCCRRFRVVAESFSVHALSYRIGCVKPESPIFEAAAELAGVGPSEIFYADDLPQHVAGARSCGFDAVQYTSTPELVAELRSRGLRFNY